MLVLDTGTDYARSIAHVGGSLFGALVARLVEDSELTAEQSVPDMDGGRLQGSEFS